MAQWVARGSKELIGSFLEEENNLVTDCGQDSLVLLKSSLQTHFFNGSIHEKILLERTEKVIKSSKRFG
jgi:hypothetical protein